MTENSVELIGGRKEAVGRKGGEETKRERERRKERSVTYASHYGNEDDRRGDRRFRGSIVETFRENYGIEPTGANRL